VRISRDRVGAGLGVERQEQDCRALAERQGLEVVSVLADNDMSAYSGRPRPAYLELLQLIRTGQVQTVLAGHTDRMHRSPVELEEFITACELQNVDVRTVQAGAIDLSSASGRMGARIYGAVARHEVEHAIERRKAAKLQAAKAGKWSGGQRP
jgi:site-specific DNA recombinase